MKIPFCIIALMTITWLPNAIPQRRTHYFAVDKNNQTRITRQTSADQMVQNILNWLQGVPSQGNRKIRQESLRTYLPPTQRPRPFEPAPSEDSYIPGMIAPDTPGLHEEPHLPFPQSPQYPGVFPPTSGPNEITSPESPGGLEPHEPTNPPDEEQSHPQNPAEHETPSEPATRPSTHAEEPNPESPGGLEPHEPTNPPDEELSHPQNPAEHETPSEPTASEGPSPDQTPHPLFPSLGPPSPPGPGEPAATGYPPAGETPYPPFPPLDTVYPPAPSGSDMIGYQPSTEIPFALSTSSPATSESEVTGYPPAGETPQPPFPPVDSPSSSEPDITGYQPADNIPSLPPTSPPISSESDVTGYPPASETPQPPFPPTASESEGTVHPPVDKPEPPGHIPDTPTAPSPTGESPASDEGPPPSYDEGPSHEGPIPESPLPTGYPSSDITPGSEEPLIPPEPTGYEPAHETPQQPDIPEGTPEAPAVSIPESVPGELSTFPPLVRPSTAIPDEETEAPSPAQPSSPIEEPSLPEISQSPSLPEVNSVSPTAETQKPAETPSQPSLPEVNVPESEPTQPEEPASGKPTEEDLNHPPHVHSIDVECAKDMMTINIEFNRQFDGVIYSKGFYTNPDCRYVDENSGQSKYTFTVKLDSCGTQFVNAFDTENQSYLENVLVLQNELGIQEVWDTIRSVRCLWEGNLSKSLTVSLSVGMLSEEIVTFSGDTAIARLDIQRGEGPFAPSATGLVPIGEKMTLVISVAGDSGFDIQVKDCKAKDTTGDLQYSLTDEDGCILRPKLFGAFQKTRNTGNTGASVIAYAFFNAFKFPDLMDLMIECNVELCKTDCDVCPNPDQKIQPGKRRRRAAYNESLGEPVKVGKLLRVLLPEDLSEGEALIEIKERKEICLTVASFVAASVFFLCALTCSFLFSGYLLLKHRNTSTKHQF